MRWIRNSAPAWLMTRDSTVAAGFASSTGVPLVDANRIAVGIDLRRCRQNRSTGHKLFGAAVHPQVKSFQAPRAEQLEIAWLGKHDFIDSKCISDPNDREPNGRGNLLPVCHN